MAELTYLQEIGAAFETADTGINALLAAAGLPELVDWFKGQPVKLRQENTPFGWYELPDAIGGEVFAQDDGEFEVPVNVGLVISANNPGELLDLVMALAPAVQAAVESVACPYWIVSGGVQPGPRVAQGGLCRAVDLPFVVRGQRAIGEVC
jgi:hypothetical protein